MLFSTLSVLCLSFFLIIIASSTAQPPPPAPYNPYDSFDFVNAGPFTRQLQGDYGSTYRLLERSATDFTMSLCFYNTTPNAYTLALGTDPQHFVWAANPSDPVREGATLSLKDDGNLVLVDVDGRLVWQTNTSNKGVMGVQTRIYGQYGNMVLYDRDNNTVWQSFDHPTDTLFPNQFLLTTGPKKLVSRVSSLGGVYTLALMPNRVSLYYKSKNSSNHPIVYYTMFKTTKTLSTLQFLTYNEYKPSFNQQFTDGSQGRYEIADLTPPSDYHYEIITSFMRLQNDGNLRVYIYQINEEGDEGWFPGYSVFKEDYVPLLNHQVDSCLLPEKCGGFGVCENGTCVACPSPQGLMPWAPGKCAPPTSSCSLGKRVKYYKVEGVEHFSSLYNKGEGHMPLGLCQAKCSLDCKCVGYFYHLDNSRCWIAHDLMTLTKSRNPKHFGFIKTSN